jgi:chromosome partitioning protein
MDNILRFGCGPDDQSDIAAESDSGMAVIAFVSSADGAGRTMLAAHIAAQAGRAGDGPVAVLDADPKGSLWDWWSRRQGKGGAPSFADRAAPGEMDEALGRLRGQGARLCLVDTPAGDACALAPVADRADLVLITADADADGATDAAALGRALAGRAAIAFVINARSHGGEQLGNLTSRLAASGGWPAGLVRHADAYAASMTAGRTVIETHPDIYAAADIAELWANLRGILVAG